MTPALRDVTSQTNKQKTFSFFSKTRKPSETQPSWALPHRTNAMGQLSLLWCLKQKNVVCTSTHFDLKQQLAWGSSTPLQLLQTLIFFKFVTSWRTCHLLQTWVRSTNVQNLQTQRKDSESAPTLLTASLTEYTPVAQVVEQNIICWLDGRWFNLWLPRCSLVHPPGCVCQSESATQESDHVSVHIFGGIMQAVYFVHVQKMRIKCFQSVIKFAVRAVNSSLVQPACRCEFHEIRVMSSQLHF